MSVSARKKLIISKLEPTYDSDSSPTGANAIEAENISITPLEAETISRDLVTPYMGASKVFHVGEHISVSFSVANQSFGTSASAPAFADLLRACGLLETIDTTENAEKAVYTPRSDNYESTTIYYYEDNILHKITGCRGTVGFGLEPSSLSLLAFSFTGLYAGPVTQSAPTADWSSFLEPTPVSPKSIDNFSLHSFAAEPHKFSFELGHEVNYQATLTSEEVKIAGRNSTGSITIDAPDLSSMNVIERVRQSLLGNLHVELGKTKGKIVEFDAPSVQLLTPKYGEVNGTTTIEMGLSFVPDAGNDEFSLIYR